MINQKQRFIAWLRQQPQRNHPDKLYAEATVNAAANLLESGLQRLGIPGYEGVNCFTITDVDTFRQLHAACYAAAMEFDKNAGYGDFRNGLDFYLQFLTENASGAANTELHKKIRFVIAHYKNNFSATDKNERYKWEALQWYKQHWNMDAPDFAAMLKNAFYKTGNLLNSGPNSLAYTQICQFSKDDPEGIRNAFSVLYDESKPLAERIAYFQKVFQDRLQVIAEQNPDYTKKLSSYQDLHAISVYLYFEYPDKYFIYKAKCYNDFSKRVGFTGTSSAQQLAIRKLENLDQLAQIVINLASAQTDLMALHTARLDASCYSDKELHLLAQDIIFYGSVYMSEDACLGGENYWPPLNEYTPGITKEAWLSLLQDRSVTTDETLTLLNKFLELGGESTFNNLVSRFGDQLTYKETLQDFSARVITKTNCTKCPNEYAQFAHYIIPFVGRMVMDGEIKRDSWKLRSELHEALKEMNLSDIFAEEEKTMEIITDVGLNTILYGPPGTGKTYHTVIYAVAIIENKKLETIEAEAKQSYQEVLNRYNEYKSRGRIEFTTFHQSYGYEEFIEGIRPAVVDEGDETEAGNIQYSVQPGMFKQFCEKANNPISAKASIGNVGIREGATVWKVSLEGTYDNPTRTECLENGHIRIGWDDYGKDITDETDFSTQGGRVVLNAFINKMQIGDIVFSCYSASTIDAIGVVTGEYEWHEEYSCLKRLRKVNWLVKGIRENILSINGGTPMTLASVYRLSNIALSDVYKLIEAYQPTQQLAPEHKDNFVFIIDEINRGNISKIFGELITLIEESKRVGKDEGMKTLLPYSMKPFGVPENVYIIGTMNTADRSIAAIDTALRRRFEFKEMLPNPDVVADISVGSLSIGNLLTKMNRRITVLYDREHTIGHAYFMPLKEDNRIEVLADIFKNKVIPLLQEYFYEDYEKIRLVLGDNQKKDDKDKFILAHKINQSELFGSADIGLDDGFTYEINQDAFMNPEAYRLI